MTQIHLLKHNLNEVHLCSFQGFKIFEYPFNQPNLVYQLVDPYGIVVEFSSTLEPILEKLDDRLSKAKG